MAEAILSIARNIFIQKYQELQKIRKQVRARKKGEPLPFDPKKLRELENLVAEMGKNYSKAEKLIQEIKRLAKK